jgi:hypothetical protein
MESTARHALERCANGLASNPERSRRQRYRACRSRAAELDGADHRAVTVEAAGAARAIETIKREKLAGYEVPRGVGGAKIVRAFVSTMLVVVGLANSWLLARRNLLSLPAAFT